MPTPSLFNFTVKSSIILEIFPAHVTRMGQNGTRCGRCATGSYRAVGTCTTADTGSVHTARDALPALPPGFHGGGLGGARRQLVVVLRTRPSRACPMGVRAPRVPLLHRHAPRQPADSQRRHQRHAHHRLHVHACSPFVSFCVVVRFQLASRRLFPQSAPSWKVPSAWKCPAGFASPEGRASFSS